MVNAMVVYAGGCGCAASNYTKLPAGAKEVVVGSEADIQECKRDDVTKIVVNAGSPTGAHRDYKTAYRQIDKNHAFKKLTNAIIDYVKKTGRAPHLVFGLGGAVGAAVARAIMEKVAIVAHCTVPSPKEMELGLVYDQLGWLMSSNKAKNSLFVMVQNRKTDEMELKQIAYNLLDMLDIKYTKLPNMARMRGEYRVKYDGEWVKIAEILDEFEECKRIYGEVRMKKKTVSDDDDLKEIDNMLKVASKSSAKAVGGKNNKKKVEDYDLTDII